MVVMLQNGSPLSVFSEYALIKYRVRVEIEYFIALCESDLPQLRGKRGPFSALRAIYQALARRTHKRLKTLRKSPITM